MSDFFPSDLPDPIALDGYLDHLRQDLARIAATPSDALDAPVAACPGWSVANLIEHHAGVLLFCTAQLRAEPGSDIQPFDPPSDDLGPLENFESAATGLLAELVAVDPAEHRPNWADAPTAAFWWRRMAQEAAVHRWDAEAAHLGSDVSPIDARLAVDGIDELVDTFFVHAKRRGMVGHGETVHLHATDDGLADGLGEWMFTFTEDGVDVERTHGKGDMAVRGPASDLLLFCWNRRPIDVQGFGEADPLTWWANKVRI